MANTVNYIIEIRDRFSSNAKSIERAVKQIETRMKGLKTKLKGIQSGLSSFGRNMSLRVTAPVAAGFAFMIKSASDAEETFSKFSVTFSKVSKEANKSFKELRNNFGLSSVEAKKLLSDTGDILSGFGFTQEAALDLSTKVQKLAVDLASFTNVEGGAKRASDALTKALLGERESVKLLGIAITEELVNERIQNRVKREFRTLTSKQLTQLEGLGIVTGRLTGMALKRAKAEATLQIALEQSKNSIGDFARTQDSFANKQRLLNSRLKDFSVTLGVLILPEATKLAAKATELVIRIGKWVEKNKQLTKTILKVAAVMATLGPIALIVGGALALILSPIGLIAIAFTGAAFLIIKNWTKVKDFFVGLKDGIVANFERILFFINGVKDAAANLVGFVSKLSIFGAFSRISKTAEITQKTQQIISGKSSVDVSGNIQVEGVNGAKVRKSKSFNPSIGLNAATAF